MTFAEAFLRRYYTSRPGLADLVERHSRVMQQLADSFEERETKTLAVTVSVYNGVALDTLIPPFEAATEAQFSESLTHFSAMCESKLLGPAKCAECGLDGNHDTWCPHWQPYVADES